MYKEKAHGFALLGLYNIMCKIREIPQMCIIIQSREIQKEKWGQSMMGGVKAGGIGAGRPGFCPAHTAYVTLSFT